MTRCLARAAMLLLIGPVIAAAQAPFADLRPDGNGIPALRTTIARGFAGERASDAIRMIADVARLSLTFDPAMPGMDTRLSVAPHERSAAAALLEVAGQSRLRMRVSPDGQIIVAVASPALSPPRPDAVPFALPLVRAQAQGVERQHFDEQADVARLTMTGRELRSAPVFVEPDLLRSVQLLPGIEARSDYAAGFNVRGGEADQNLILLDGYPIFSPFHVGGMFGTFIGPTVGRIDIHTGGLPVRYGGRLSSALVVHSARPTSPTLEGTVEVSLVSSTVSVGRTFRQGEGSWMLAARRTYADAVANMLKPGSFPYHFRDVQGHADMPLGHGMRLSATLYDGVDVIVPSPGDEMNFGGDWGNRVIGATLTKTIARAPRVFGRSLGDSVALVMRLSGTTFNLDMGVPGRLFHANNRMTEVRVAGSATSFGARVTHEIGYELSSGSVTYDADSRFSGLDDLIPFDSLRRRLRVASVYADELWRVSPSLLVEGGVRVDAIGGGHGMMISPRVSLKYFLSRNTALTAATGRYAQWVHSLGREEQPVQPFQFWISSDSSKPVSRARDAIVGLERWVSPRRLFRVEGFYKSYDNLLLPDPAHAPDVSGDELLPTRGRSYGAEVLLRQLDGAPFSGWLAYTYAVNRRVGPDGERYWPTQDRRHNLNLVGSWRAGPYVFGARLNVASGMPHTPVLGAFVRERYDPTQRRWVVDRSVSNDQHLSGPRNSERLPSYDRLDVSVTRTGRIRGALVSPYFSIVNVFNSDNPAGYQYSFGSARPSRSSFPNLPLVPTFGVTIAY